MNLSEISEQELNMLIAEKVMDRHVKDIERWSPSTDIVAAWEVVEKLRGIGILVTIGPWPWHGKYRATTWNSDRRKHENETIAGTAPLAICYIALKAMGDV